MMSEILAIAAVGVLLLLVFSTNFLLRRKPKHLNKEYYTERWQTLQKLLKDKATWPLAVIDADKTMGERLVSAQRSITDNDAVWFGHKLRNRLVHESNVKLTEKNVKDALLGIRSALKDLGAL
jgi:hypothetical protein